jgi:hypothetical protein
VAHLRISQRRARRWALAGLAPLAFGVVGGLFLHRSNATTLSVLERLQGDLPKMERDLAILERWRSELSPQEPRPSGIAWAPKEFVEQCNADMPSYEHAHAFTGFFGLDKVAGPLIQVTSSSAASVTIEPPPPTPEQ